MAQAVFVQEGGAIDYTPTADVPAGEVVVQGSLIGVTRAPVSANRLGSLAVQGVFDFTKAAGVAISVGAQVYWDNTNKVATTTAGSNVLVGKCIQAAAAADARVRVRMSQ